MHTRTFVFTNILTCREYARCQETKFTGVGCARQSHCGKKENKEHHLQGKIAPFSKNCVCHWEDRVEPLLGECGYGRLRELRRRKGRKGYTNARRKRGHQIEYCFGAATKSFGAAGTHACACELAHARTRNTHENTHAHNIQHIFTFKNISAMHIIDFAHARKFLRA